MAYSMPGYGMGLEAQPFYENPQPSRYRAGEARYRNGGMFNMPTDSPYAPVNQGGPGNPNGASNMPRLPRFQNNKGPAPLTKPDRQMYGYPGSGINPNGMYSRGPARQPSDPFEVYGYAGQSPQLGRYVPPTMADPNAPGGGGWLGGGGYAYNIPNSYGSGQWNQFNSTDTAFRNFGQSQNTPRTPSVRYAQPFYQSPFSQGDSARQANLNAFLGIYNQSQQPQYTQPGSPDQPGPTT